MSLLPQMSNIYLLIINHGPDLEFNIADRRMSRCYAVQDSEMQEWLRQMDTARGFSRAYVWSRIR